VIHIRNCLTGENLTVVRGLGSEDEDYHNNILEKFKQMELRAVPPDLLENWEFCCPELGMIVHMKDTGEK